MIWFQKILWVFLTTYFLANGYQYNKNLNQAFELFKESFDDVKFVLKFFKFNFFLGQNNTIRLSSINW